MDLSLIQGTITGLKTASDIAKGFLELKSLADVQTKVIDLQSAILSAQSNALSANADQAAAAEEIRKLKEELARLKAWEEQRKRYRLVSPWTGAAVYALREAEKGSDPPHWICTKCYEDNRRSILNPRKNPDYWFSYVCPVCKSDVQSPYRGASQQEYATD